jgi:hypothetical protein
MLGGGASKKKLAQKGKQSHEYHVKWLKRDEASITAAVQYACLSLSAA